MNARTVGMAKTKMADLFHSSIYTKFGHMRAVSDGDSLIRLDWDQSPFPEPDRPNDVSRETCHQLTAYIAGERRSFQLPLKAEDKSPIARFWLTSMARIPYGSVMT